MPIRSDIGRRDAPRHPPFWLVGAVTMTGTAALHILLPALPAIAHAFHVSPQTTALAITLYLVGMAFGQLAYGPLSDRFGRRPLLLWSLSLYLAGLLLGFAAPGIIVLLIARVLQSAGGCGSLVLGRAMVRDVSGAADAARQLATLGLLMTATPALAPALGNLVEATLGWRAIFLVLAGVEFVLFVLVIGLLPETNKNPILLPGFRAVLAEYAVLLRSSRYRRYTLAGSCSATSLYAFFAASPFLLTIRLHQPSRWIGFSSILAVAGMMIGGLAARRLARTMSVPRAARLGNGICLTASLLLTGLTVVGQMGLAALLMPVVLYAVGVGLLSPNALAGLMNTHPERAGAASSLYGFIQMGFGAAFTLSVSADYGPPGFPVALALTVAAGCAALALRRM